MINTQTTDALASSIKEAFAAGIPVLASNVYGNADQIKHNENGLLFTFNDVASLRQQLLKCIKEKELLTQLKKNIKAPRNFKDVAVQYHLLYNRICGLL
jgi:glycosyltransferase involved in cell wall biosynthesis